MPKFSLPPDAGWFLLLTAFFFFLVCAVSWLVDQATLKSGLSLMRLVVSIGVRQVLSLFLCFSFGEKEKLVLRSFFVCVTVLKEG